MATLTALLSPGAAHADRVAGLASISTTRSAKPRSAPSAPALHSGTVSALRADGSQIEIDGKWYLVKAGRSLLLRRGLPVDASALAMGQKLSFSLASTTPGELALGVVHVP